MKQELYIGVMSGTSADGIDLVLAEINESSFQLIDFVSSTYSEALRSEIKELSSPGADEINRSAQLGIKLSKETAKLIKQLLDKANTNASEVSAIGYHGQTIRHHPATEHAYSVQIGCPSTLAYLTGITTITDFRMADIAAGGQGAPLVPAFHQFAFQTAGKHRFILNIGGIANISYLPAHDHSPVIGFDTGPGNTLIDEWTYLHQGKYYDEGGEWAATGSIIPELLAALLSDNYIQKPVPKSTGKEHFNLAWLASHLNAIASYSIEDVQRTLVEFTAVSIANSIKQILTTISPSDGQVYVCGGGVHNQTLMQALKQLLSHFTVHSTEELGLPPQLVEGSAFAWLARQTLNGKTGNLPSVTGATNKRILGGIYLN